MRVWRCHVLSVADLTPAMLAILVLCASSCVKDDPNTVNSDEANHQEQVFVSDQQRFQKADVVCYVEILEVDKKIEESSSGHDPLEGEVIIHPEQTVRAQCLKVLKGPEELQGTTLVIVKQRSDFHLVENQRRVLHLSHDAHRFRTVGWRSGEWRLPSVLSIANTLKNDAGSGIVVGVLAEYSLKNSMVHILKGRHRAPVTLHSRQWEEALTGAYTIGDFDIAEIFVEPGSYTVLLEVDGTLRSFSRLVFGYYPYVIVEEHQWRTVYFDVEEM